MKFVVAAIVACLVGYASGLQCLTCEGNSIAECDKNAVMTTCFSNQDSCETIVRRYGLNNRAQHKVIKQCKQAQACMTLYNRTTIHLGHHFNATVTNQTQCAHAVVVMMDATEGIWTVLLPLELANDTALSSHTAITAVATIT
uniref:Uncharacterized protein n=1 Tax=Ciona savignyi TaxID=51511 RepID=H2YUL7_CIOSA